jgi:hypothetical protein
VSSPHPYPPFVATESEWSYWRDEADRWEQREADSGTTYSYRWNDDRYFLGVVGEETYSRISGLPRRRGLFDGGEDFPGIDCKAVPYYDTPKLMRWVEMPLTAPVYFLAAVDMETRRVRPVGYATRAMLEAAPQRDYRFGLTRTLSEGDLLGPDELISHLFATTRLLEAVLL